MGRLQLVSMRKFPTAWANFYGAVTLGMIDNILSWDGKKFTVTACPTRGP